MGVVGLAWYIGAVSALLAVLTSAITYVPGTLEWLPAGFGVLALLVMGVAIELGRLSPAHRIRQSRSLWIGFVVAAVTVTFMAALVG